MKAALPPLTRVTAVLGVCPPERRRLAEALGGDEVVSIGEDLEVTEVHEMIDRAVRDGSRGTARILDCPSATSAAQIVALFTGEDGLEREGHRLERIITVVDAAHLGADLGREDYLRLDGEGAVGGGELLVPWALVAVTQIEHASVLAVVGWRALSRERLTETLALLCHLNPAARLRLERRGWERGLGTLPDGPVGGAAGWAGVLDATDPASTHRRVSRLRYERARPFHAGRLAELIEAGFPEECGHLVRSSGICRIAGRDGLAAYWDQVGAMLSFEPTADSSFGDAPVLGQELTLVGFDLGVSAIEAALDACLLTDDEFLAPVSSWASFPDPFPSWNDD